MSENTKKPKKKSKVFIVIIIVCIVVIAFAAYKLISINMEYKQGRDEYDSLQQYTTENDISDAGVASSSTSDDTNAAGEASSESPIGVDCKQLETINPDFAAWLYLGAEDISYPVVHYTDNEYYLHRTFEKAEVFSGTIFIEAMNSADLTDPNTIIYGHNMKDRSMFGKLKFLQENEDYKKDDTFWLMTSHGDYQYKMFSIRIIDPDSDAYTLFSEPGEEVVEYIKNANSESMIDFDMPECDENSRVVTLSTCYGSDSARRFVVQGILVNEE